MWETETGLRRYVIECDTLAAANDVRDRWPDAVVPADDRRSKRVTISGDVLDKWRYAMERLGTVDEPESFGQRSLTDAERWRIDFTETNVFHARSCKAIGCGLDVDDWLAHYDPTLTVDEHRDVYERAAGRAPTLRRMQTPDEFRLRSAEVTVGV